MKEKFSGIIPALVTPYTETGEINEESLRNIIRLNLKKGVTGFYVNGSTAETFLLSQDERKQLIEIVTDEVKDKATVIYHVGNIHLADSIDLAKYGEKVGVDAISAIPPFYYKFNYQEITEYYQRIIHSTSLPMIIYNFPANSGVEISFEHFNELLSDDQIIGIKHTSMNLYELERLVTNGKVVLNGHDEVLLGGLIMGASGGIGSTYNIMAEKYIAIFNLFKENKITEAQKLQIQANNVIEALLKVGVNQGIKYGLEKMGIPCNGCRKPFRELTKNDQLYLDQVFRDNDVI